VIPLLSSPKLKGCTMPKKDTAENNSYKNIIGMVSLLLKSDDDKSPATFKIVGKKIKDLKNLGYSHAVIERALKNVYERMMSLFNTNKSFQSQNGKVLYIFSTIQANVDDARRQLQEEANRIRKESVVIEDHVGEMNHEKKSDLRSFLDEEDM